MRQWHLACSEGPSISTVGTNIPQQIPSLPCDSSTLRLVPYHPSSPFSALSVTCTCGDTVSLARAALRHQNSRQEAVSRAWDLSRRGHRGDTHLSKWETNKIRDCSPIVLQHLPHDLWST